jgi:hypothetical protein
MKFSLISHALFVVLGSFGHSYLINHNRLSRYGLNIHSNAPTVQNEELAPRKGNNLQTSDDEYFGSEFKVIEQEGVNFKFRNGKKVKIIDPNRRNELMQPFYDLRLQLLADNVYMFALGFFGVWYFGAMKDVFSYGVGGILGIIYSFLLGRYVEDLGEQNRGGGNARFVPVILLIAIYAKFKTEINILPEILGFFSYKVAPFLRAFDTRSSDDYRSKS